MASLAFIVAPTAPCGLRRSTAFSQSVKSAVTVRATPTRSLKVFASSQPELDKVIEEKIQEAKNVCADPNSGSAECAVAWDEVEEISAAISHKEAQKSSDPLEQYCDENPDADECRIYSD
ncbi:unnamed protein product [Closterium sp. NIES-53]